MASHRAANQGYVYGTAARNMAAERERTRKQRVVQYRQDMSHTVRRNQEKALQMDLPYVIMLTLAAVCALYICVGYLHVQSSMTAKIHNIEGLEQELAGDSSRTIMKIRIEKTGENERRIKVRGHIVCPLCGSNEISRAVVKQTGDTVRICEGCGALCTEPRISADNSTTFAHYMESRGLKPYWNELEGKQYL